MKYSFSNDAVAGAFAGVVARLLTAPFDLVKIRFQLQNHLKGAVPKYNSILQTFKVIVREEGENNIASLD